MNARLAALAGVMALAAALPAAAMTRAEYSAQRSRIQDKYATDKDRCWTRGDVQRRVCEVQARVAYDIARLELRAQYRPTPSNVEKARHAKADAARALDEARCDDLRASAKKVCVDEARAKWKNARAEEHAAASEAR
ncbi:hypothetical protein [Ramlibacter albus]|uniref:DUF1090 family protein n=1 Tax=Ramlibacter albus TaxID=2079448 RepID=A0A923MA75_9BURK|nr:hypothetical protein [Ramlibacter albus]MBC5766210.1 hypothetical protein [Ramlibacter albus]